MDLDFPVVYRAECGFDAIAQAAGRCNREGSLPGLGITYVFESERPPPPGFQRDTAQVAREYFSKFPDPLLPQAIDAYFRHYYWKSGDLLDKYQILDRTTIDRVRGQTHFQFCEIEANYKIIRDTQLPILIPFVPSAQRYPLTAPRPLRPHLLRLQVEKPRTVPPSTLSFRGRLRRIGACWGASVRMCEDEQKPRSALSIHHKSFGRHT